MSALATDPFATLNEEQRAAVEHRGEPLLVIAGAGTGKTMTLAARVARLVLDGADPNRLLLLTFSRRAAQEMERRAGRMLHTALGLRATQGTPMLPWAGTFHAVGARLLREYAGSLGLAPQFTLLDRGDAEDLMGWVRQELELGSSGQRFPLKGTCLAIYSRVVNARESVDTVVQTMFPWVRGAEAELKRLFAAYVDAKQQQQVLDYDDLLLYWAQMVAEPALGAEIGGLFDHVLVDEYQDTNHLQAAILLALKPDGRGLTVVGDDAQSIYAFRGATVRNILDFPAAFAPPATVVTLEQNYRSTRPILEAANAVIALAAERFTKNLWSERESAAHPRLVSVKDEADQAAFVADTVLARREEGLALRQQAVLFRAGGHSARLELELARRNVPFVKYGGLKFLEAAHVKDLLAILRWLDNPRNAMAGFRVLQLLKGMGPVNARRALDHLAKEGGSFTALRGFEPPSDSALDWKKLLELLTTLADPQLPWPGQVNQVRTWYRPHLERLYEHVHTRIGDLDQLELLSGQYPSRERFITELTLDPPQASGDLAGQPLLDEDYLVLSTVHSAKGMEWDTVYVLNVVDGSFPSEFATGRAETIEEERRLLYVAMTRAKDDLALVQPLKFPITQQAKHGDAHVYGGRSRFMSEKVLKTLDSVAFQGSRLGEASLAETGQSALDAVERVKSMW